MPKRTPPGQLGLLEWEPPKPVAKFAEDQVRAVSIADRLSRAVSATLKDSTLSREEIAQRMGEYLGAPLSRHVLDAYASQGREDHVINVVRFIALLHATQDRRLLEVVAEIFGWAVIERKFLKLIELAALQEREDELRRQAKAVRREAKFAGII